MLMSHRNRILVVKTLINKTSAYLATARGKSSIPLLNRTGAKKLSLGTLPQEGVCTTSKGTLSNAFPCAFHTDNKEEQNEVHES